MKNTDSYLDNGLLIETWYKVWCPFCKSENWIIQAKEDIDGVNCYNCQKEFWILPKEYIDDRYSYEGDERSYEEILAEEAYVCQGRLLI